MKILYLFIYEQFYKTRTFYKVDTINTKKLVYVLSLHQLHLTSVLNVRKIFSLYRLSFIVGLRFV